MQFLISGNWDDKNLSTYSTLAVVILINLKEIDNLILRMLRITLLVN